MKIVDVAEFYAEEGGGVRTYINQKLQAGAEAGHEIVIIAPGPEDKEEDRLGGRIIWVKGPALIFDPRYYILYKQKAVHQILDREKPDVVEGSSPWTGGWFTANWKGDAVKTFIFHQDPVAVYPQTLLGNIIGIDRVDKLFGWYWSYLRRLSSHFDATIVSGYWLAEKLSRFGIKRPEPVPFGINKSQFSPEKRDFSVKEDLLLKCGVSPKSKLLVTVSRHHPEKRLGTLIKAFKKASEKEPLGLVIYGDGPLKFWIKRKARKVKGVYVAGFTKSADELATALASADAMLHGSAAETYGLVVAEAICSGLPVIVPNIGGANDLARHEYAETYPPGDTNGCAEAIIRLLKRDKNSLRVAAKLAVNEKIGTVNDHFKTLFDTYERLVNEKKKQI